MTNRTFTRGKTTYICERCNKVTRDTQGEEQAGLCLDCYREGEIENEHFDNDHTHNPENRSKCPICQEDLARSKSFYLVAPNGVKTHCYTFRGLVYGINGAAMGTSLDSLTDNGFTIETFKSEDLE